MVCFAKKDYFCGIGFFGKTLIGMNRLLYLFFGVVFCMDAVVLSADDYPSASPSAMYVTAEGEETDDVSEGVSAPLSAVFYSNVEDLGEYTGFYEWRVFTYGNEESPLIDRFDEDLEYTFNESGTFYVQFYATFVNGNDTIEYSGGSEEGVPFVVLINESVLEMPNAFSPNGDGYNDVYRAKEGYQSIVSFKATIFNRWGQALYSWDSVDGGWDGKHNGRTVRDGVYFVRVTARGADGKEYDIRRDVNVLTGYRGGGSSSSGDD